jgi:cell division initiation protein
MSLTPVEIRHVDLGRRPLGYDRTAVDELLADVAASFEHVWRERADLRDELEELESELARQKELEQALRNTLLSAERMADDMRAQARREADVIVAEARSAARDIASGAESERERIRTEIRRLREVETGVRADYRAFLLAALDRLESDTEDRRAAHQAA